MLEALSERLGAIFDRLANRGRLSESDVAEVLREVRVALLEADVALPVAKAFVAAIKEKAVGSDILTSLSPAQSVIKLVYDELVDLLGGAAARLTYSDAPPTVYVMVGLQGSGKTTHAGKLALRLKEQGRRTLLVAADVYRPAAIDQLKTLGKQIDLPVYDQGQGDPVKIARDGVAEARRLGIPTVIVDTAGRLQIDERLMTELEQIKAAVKPTEILFVADAMTGQEAVNVAQTFNERLGITGVILTKMDGDARGGAALSIHRMTGAPIKFVGVGEKITALEQFYPDRLASRILGMGDVLTLIEKTQSVYSEQQAEDLAQKLRKSQFTLDDFLAQLRQKVVERELRLAQLLGKVFGLLLGVDRLGLLDQGEDVTHPEDARGETVRVELLERGDLLADADELDRSAGHAVDRERRTAARVAVHLGQDHARDPEPLVERLGDVDRLLSGHRVGDEQDLGRLDRRLDLLELRHQALVDLQPPRGVDDDGRNPEPARLGDAVARDLHRIALALVVDRQIDLLAEGLELIDRRGPIDVGRDQQRAAALLFEPQRELARVRRLARTLKPDHDVHGRRRIAVGQARRGAAQQVHQLVVDQLDDALRRAQRGEDVAADGLLFDRRDERLRDRQRDVGFEQRDADFAQYLSDVRLRESAAVRQPVEDRA